MATIELDQVSRRFGALTAVDHVSFRVDAGEIVGLLGHNGAGKTTLIRVINGLLTPDTGAVRVGGLDPVADGHRVRATTGVLTEYPALDDYLDVRENLEVYAAINGLPRKVAAGRIDALLERLGLADHAVVPARRLSAGLKQRVALARALVHDPHVLLLDEPTTNMDPVAARDVRAMILESARERGHTVLLSTHNLAEAEILCDRVGIMRQGRLLALGTSAALRGELGGLRGVRIGTAPGAVGSVAAAVDGTARVRSIDEHQVEVLGDVTVPVLVKRLVDAGVEVHAVEPLAPTLEDLYVSLHHRDGGSGTSAVGA
jgi:ABC-2 type transport system ATP-binding protein